MLLWRDLSFYHLKITLKAFASTVRIKKNTSAGRMKTHRLLFCRGNTNCKHNHPWSIHTQRTVSFSLFVFSVCAFFLYKRVSEEKHQKPVTISAVKGNLREQMFGNIKKPLNTFPSERKATQQKTKVRKPQKNA